MTSKKNPKVDAYLKESRWGRELSELRTILLDTPMAEELKWGKPCYTFRTSNLVVLYSLKESCALGFLKGALLQDANGLLTRPGENSQSARWIKFTATHEITAMKLILKGYLEETINAEKAGLKVDFRESKKLTFPEELENRLRENASLKTAFDALTPGRRRGYNLYFSGAKQSQTRESRIDKCVERILAGKGLHDR